MYHVDMPQLPTFNVTDAQAQRILKAFGTPEAYKEWLKEAIAIYVGDVEGRVLEEDVQTRRRSLVDNIRRDFGV